MITDTKVMNIDKIKEEVVEDIKELKCTGRYTKEQLIERFKKFKKEDFCCFAKDGNTYLTPEEYYNNPTIPFSKAEAKRELKSIRLQQNFHRIDKEDGVNLLRCCNECRDVFLRNIFTEKILTEGGEIDGRNRT